MTARWALLVGGKGTGQSSLAARASAELARRGVAVGGVVQDATEDDGGRSYLARHVGGSESVVVARKGAPPKGARPDALLEFCSFVFDTDAFARARGWIRQDAEAADVVVIDEVSKLEVSRGGHHDAIRDALFGRAIVLLVVRGDQLFSVVERFELNDEPIESLDTGEETAFARFVDELARAAGRTAGR
ncbi:MAG TPA: nucleoside-triphosphatase [Polyangiaceae bacterium]